jgi:hypothetical protein
VARWSSERAVAGRRVAGAVAGRGVAGCSRGAQGCTGPLGARAPDLQISELASAREARGWGKIEEREKNEGERGGEWVTNSRWVR